MNLAEHFEALEWTQSTAQVEVKGVGWTTWPRHLGASADGKTALELIGSLDNIRSITLLGQMSAADLEATRRNGAYAAVCLAIVAPNWAGRDAWLTHEMRRLATTKQTTLRKRDWTIGLRFEGSTFTFKAIRA